MGKKLWFVLTTIMVLTAILVTACSQAAPNAAQPVDLAQKTSGTTEPRSTPTGGLEETDAQVPPEISRNANGWPLANKDYLSSRATFDSPINSTTVNNLGVAWSFPVQPGQASSNPLIFDGTVLFQDLQSNVIALNLSDGAVKWRKDYNLPNLGPNGPAIGYGKVFVDVGTDSIAALDINNGQEIWKQKLSKTPSEGIDIQPVVYSGLVYVSTNGGGTPLGNVGGATGIIYALDQQSGKVRWSFDTVDSSDIWGNKTVNSGGGCYFPPAIDRRAQDIFFGTANPAPFPGTAQFPNGSSRPGPNLYTNSMLSLNLHSGKLQWFTQVYPHDLFNYSLAISPVLATATINGAQQDIVIGTGKTGRVYGFNRKTGAILWETVVGTHSNDQLALLPPGDTIVFPGELGGVETPMAYAGGVVYVAVDDMSIDVTPSTYTPADLSTTSGEMLAIEVDTGKIVWDKKFPALNIGAATVINDLVFMGTLDGNVYALNRATGDIVFTYPSAPGINGWAAVSNDTIVMLAGVNGSAALVALKLGAGQATVSH